MTKRKIRVGRVILLLLLIVGLGVLLAFGVSRILFKKPNNDKPNNPVIVEPDNNDDKEKDKLQIDLVNYDVYFNDFCNFVIAEIRFKDEKPIDLNLDNLITSDKIKLSEYSSYKTKLESNGYYLSKLNVVYEIKSNDKEYTCKLFVPFTTKNTKISLFNIDKEICQFDLMSNGKNIENIKYTTGSEINDSDNYTIFVSNAYRDDFMKYKGENYALGSSTKVFVYELSIKEIKNGVKLENAEFISSDNEVYEALNADYTSSKIVNMIGSELKTNNKYGIFVEVFSPDSDPLSYDGKLRLKFSSSDEWIELSTSLN